MSFFSEALSHIPIFHFFFNNSHYPKGKLRKERSRNSFSAVCSIYQDSFDSGESIQNENIMV